MRMSGWEGGGLDPELLLRRGRCRRWSCNLILTFCPFIYTSCLVVGRTWREMEMLSLLSIDVNYPAGPRPPS